MTGLDQRFESLNVLSDTLPIPSTGYSSAFPVGDEIICNSLSIDNPKGEKISIKVSPIPAENYITISSQSELSQIEIYDLLGTLVQRSMVKHIKEVEIDTSDLTPAIYFLKIVSKENIVTKKIIRN
jgi:hypothetical protein